MWKIIPVRGGSKAPLEVKLEITGEVVVPSEKEKSCWPGCMELWHSLCRGHVDIQVRILDARQKKCVPQTAENYLNSLIREMSS